MILSDIHKLPAIDIDTYNDLATILGDDFLDLIQDFRQQTSSGIDKMCAALQANDLEQVCGIAHQLCSTTGNLGIMALSSLFRLIEKNIIDETAMDVTETTRALHDEFQRAENELKLL